MNATPAPFAITEQQLDAGLAAWFGITKVMPEREILRDRMRAAIAAAGHGATLPPLNDSLVDILGRVCFRCAGIAQILRAGGQVIPTRAENEQAATIHFLLAMYLQHGVAWELKAHEALLAMAQLARSESEKLGAAAEGEAACRQ